MTKTGPKILIVEDETGLQNALGDKLTREGFNVLKASNGADGLEQALAEHPDLLLADIVMPKMDGMTMIRKLRQDPWGKEAKVILLTNLNEPVKTEEAIEVGVYDYLIKTDWKLIEVVEKIKSKLEMEKNEQNTGS